MRIVSLLPSATELVAELGLRASLVGVSHECDTPPDVAELPRLTASTIGHDLGQEEIDAAVSRAVREGLPLYAVDGPALAALEPDLIVTQGLCDVCAVTERTITHALQLLPDGLLEGVPTLSLDGVSWEGVLADLRRLGDATGRGAEARARAQEARARWDAVVKRRLLAPRRGLAFLEWVEPPFFGGHWVPEQIAAAGGLDVLGDGEGPSGRVSPEAVAEANPDVLVVGCCGFDLAANLAHAAAVRAHPVLGALRAVAEGRLWAVDANACFSRPSLRLARGVELLAHILEDGADLPGEAARVP